MLLIFVKNSFYEMSHCYCTDRQCRKVFQNFLPAVCPVLSSCCRCRLLLVSQSLYGLTIFSVSLSVTLNDGEVNIYIKDYKKENHWLGDGVKVHNLKSKPHAFSCTQIKFLFKSKTIISWTMQAFTGQEKTLAPRNCQSHIISVWKTSI